MMPTSSPADLSTLTDTQLDQKIRDNRARKTRADAVWRNDIIHLDKGTFTQKNPSESERYRAKEESNTCQQEYLPLAAERHRRDEIKRAARERGERRQRQTEILDAANIADVLMHSRDVAQARAYAETDLRNIDESVAKLERKLAIEIKSNSEKRRKQVDELLNDPEGTPFVAPAESWEQPYRDAIGEMRKRREEPLARIAAADQELESTKAELTCAIALHELGAILAFRDQLESAVNRYWAVCKQLTYADLEPVMRAWSDFLRVDPERDRFRLTFMREPGTEVDYAELFDAVVKEYADRAEAEIEATTKIQFADTEERPTAGE